MKTYEYIPIFYRDIKNLSQILGSKEIKAERHAVSAPYSKCMRNKRITCDNKLPEQCSSSSAPKKLIVQSFDLVLGCPDDSLPSSQHSSLGSTSSGDEQSSIIPVLSPPRELDARSIKPVSPIYSGPKEQAYNIFDSSFIITPYKPVIESSPDFFDSLFVTEMPSIPRFPEQWGFPSFSLPFSCDLPPPILSF